MANEDWRLSMSKLIPDGRFRHMYGVGGYMYNNAERYGLIPDEAFFIGMCHDIGYIKEKNVDMRSMEQNYYIVSGYRRSLQILLDIMAQLLESIKKHLYVLIQKFLMH